MIASAAESSGCRHYHGPSSIDWEVAPWLCCDLVARSYSEHGDNQGKVRMQVREWGGSGSSAGGGGLQAVVVLQEPADGAKSQTMERKNRVKGSLQCIRAGDVSVHQANLHHQITQCHNDA